MGEYITDGQIEGVQVGIVIGSESDESFLKGIKEVFDGAGVTYMVSVFSAHRPQVT